MPSPEYKERLRDTDINPVILPNTVFVDWPIEATWGLFDYAQFQRNRKGLLAVPPSDDRGVQLKAQLRGPNYEAAKKVLQNLDQCTEVRRNIASSLGIPDLPDLNSPMLPERLVREFIGQIRSHPSPDVILFGTQHNILDPIHKAMVSGRSEDMKVAEVVLDRQIGVRSGQSGVMFSDSFYRDLAVKNGLSTVFFGADDEAVEDFYQNEPFPKGIAFGVTKSSDVELDVAVEDALGAMKARGITNVTFSVDLGVLREAFSVRNSWLLPYLGLGCQVLPDELVPADLESLECLRHANPKMVSLLRDENILLARDPQSIRAARHKALAPNYGGMAFKPELLRTNLRTGAGLSQERVVKIINKLRSGMARYGLMGGVPFLGHVYKGSVVEMCGFEGPERNTSSAAVKIARAIGAEA